MILDEESIVACDVGNNLDNNWGNHKKILGFGYKHDSMPSVLDKIIIVYYDYR